MEVGHVGGVDAEGAVRRVADKVGWPGVSDVCLRRR